MRFLVDESLQRHVAKLLVDNGRNAVHVSDTGLRGAPDETAHPQVGATSARAGRADCQPHTFYPFPLVGRPLRRGRPGGSVPKIVIAVV